ncbi:hypothetical protein FSP39_009370 [Pinctada imbricata]|uniref:FLYWCH-type domain-containing protein n=1 Tax=Pinctada imbricata TaxID=66713 RepID=A0AA88XY26_PINIB|nr:hypothetical protein FSP39_009370 [Pinctada imbricata]
MKRREIELPFTCSRCRLPIPDRSPLSDDIENVLAPPAKRRRRKIPKIKKSKPKHQPLQPPSPTPLPSMPLLSTSTNPLNEPLTYSTNCQQHGYAYTVKKTTQYATYWRCSVRSSTLWCRASVTQRGTTFTP